MNAIENTTVKTSALSLDNAGPSDKLKSPQRQHKFDFGDSSGSDEDDVWATAKATIQSGVEKAALATSVPASGPVAALNVPVADKPAGRRLKVPPKEEESSTGGSQAVSEAKVSRSVLPPPLPISASARGKQEALRGKMPVPKLGAKPTAIEDTWGEWGQPLVLGNQRPAEQRQDARQSVGAPQTPRRAKPQRASEAEGALSGAVHQPMVQFNEGAPVEAPERNVPLRQDGDIGRYVGRALGLGAGFGGFAAMAVTQAAAMGVVIVSMPVAVGVGVVGGAVCGLLSAAVDP